jgi:predicted cupin superfamily sugar epimerase
LVAAFARKVPDMDDIAPALASLLHLEPHPEGGWFRQTWRAELTLPAAALPGEYGGDRSAATCISYLLAPGERSRWHRVRSAELWLWQGGGTLRLDAGGSAAEPGRAEPVLLGPDVASGQTLQYVIAPDTWQQAEPAGDEAVLVACVVAPGFDWADFTLGPE